MMAKVARGRLLNHKITRQTGQLFDDDGTDVDRVRGCKHLSECGPVGSFNCAANAFVYKFTDEGEAVCFPMGLDRRALQWETIARYLALAAYSQIAECLYYDSSLDPFAFFVNTNFADMVDCQSNQ